MKSRITTIIAIAALAAAVAITAASCSPAKEVTSPPAKAAPNFADADGSISSIVHGIITVRGREFLVVAMPHKGVAICPLDPLPRMLFSSRKDADGESVTLEASGAAAEADPRRFLYPPDVGATITIDDADKGEMFNPGK